MLRPRYTLLNNNLHSQSAASVVKHARYCPDEAKLRLLLCIADSTPQCQRNLAHLPICICRFPLADLEQPVYRHGWPQINRGLESHQQASHFSRGKHCLVRELAYALTGSANTVFDCPNPMATSRWLAQVAHGTEPANPARIELARR